MEKPPAISHTVARAVELSNISRARLYELMESGELPYSKIESKRLILDDDLRALLLRHRVVKPPQSAR